MKNRNLIVKFFELPVREKEVFPAHLSKIFGGCLLKGDYCNEGECCPGLKCMWVRPTSNNKWCKE